MARAPVNEEEFLGALYKGGELLGSGKLVEARQLLEKAHGLSPKNEKAQNLLGLTYFKLGLFDQASSIYEKLVNENPADPTLRVNLGLVYLKTNNLPRCIKEFETATDLDPEHKKAHNYLGLALAQAGDYGKAREHFVLAGSEQMAEKMARAQTARIESAPSSHGLVVPSAPPATAEAVTAKPARPTGPRPAPAEPAPQEDEIEVMSDAEELEVDAPSDAVAVPVSQPMETVPTTVENIDVQTEPLPDEPLPDEVEVEIAAPPPSSPRLERDWGAQFGMEGELPVIEAAADEPAPTATRSWAEPRVKSWDADNGAEQQVPASDRVMETTLDPAAEDPAWQAARAASSAAAQAQAAPETDWNTPPDPASELDFGGVAPEDSASNVQVDPAVYEEASGSHAVTTHSALEGPTADFDTTDPHSSGGEAPSTDPSVDPPPTSADPAADPNVPYADPNAAYSDPNAAYADPNAAYADPNAAYADPNGSYADPHAAYADPNTAYADPNASYADPNTADQDPNAAYADPNAAYADPNAAYADPNASYADPNAAYAAPNAAYADPNAAHADPNTAYADPNTAHDDPNAAYADPNAAYAESNEAYADPNAAYADPNTANEYPNAADPNASSPSGPYDDTAGSPDAASTDASTSPTDDQPAWDGDGVQPLPTGPLPPPRTDTEGASHSGAWVAQPLSTFSPTGGPPPPSAPTLYSPMQAKTLVELGASTSTIDEPQAGPFHVGPHGLAISVNGEMLSRMTNLVAIVGSVNATPEKRRARGRATDQAFGDGPGQMQRLTGHGVVHLEMGGARFHALDLNDDGAYLREERVFGFEESISFEHGRLSAPENSLTLDLVHLSGDGRVLLQLNGAMKSLAVPAGAPMVVPLQRLVGWFGRVTPRLTGFAGQGAVELTGDGFALLVAPG